MANRFCGLCGRGGVATAAVASCTFTVRLRPHHPRARNSLQIPLRSKCQAACPRGPLNSTSVGDFCVVPLTSLTCGRSEQCHTTRLLGRWSVWTLGPSPTVAHVGHEGNDFEGGVWHPASHDGSPWAWWSRLVVAVVLGLPTRCGDPRGPSSGRPCARDLVMIPVGLRRGAGCRRGPLLVSDCPGGLGCLGRRSYQ